MLFENKKQGDLHYAIWKIEEGEQLLQSLLPASFDFTQVHSFKSEKRRVEWLAVRVLFSFMGYDPTKITYKKSGKPFIIDGSLFFSCSHTKGYVSVIVHPNQEVGIDIEERGVRVEKVITKFLHPEEICQFEIEDSRLYYHLCWSAKEAVFKIIDKKDFDFINLLTVTPFRLFSAGTFTVVEKLTSKQQEFEIHYNIKDDFVLCWVSKDFYL